MPGVEQYLQAIRRAYPDLRVTSAAWNELGQNNDVLVADGAFVFRFPKYPAGREDLIREVAILRGIREYITLEIPEPSFVNLESQPIGEAFVGYRLIPGEPLRVETLQSIRDSRTLDALADQLGTFLRELHHVPAQTAIAYPLPLGDTAAEWSDLFARMRAALFPHMRPDARAEVAREFERFLQELQGWAYEPALKHDDFGTSNIVYDAERQTIRGIIDFGSSGLGDPACDLAGLWGYGETFLRRLVRDDPELEACWDRARFYHGTFALLEALFGIENGDTKAFESGIAGYR